MLLVDQTTSRSAIHVIRPDQLNAGTLQTPGSQRLAAISAAQGIASALWAGTFLVLPFAVPLALVESLAIWSCRRYFRSRLTWQSDGHV